MSWLVQLWRHISVLGPFLKTLAPFRIPGHSHRAKVFHAIIVVSSANNVVEENHQPLLPLLLDLVGDAEEEDGGDDQEDQDNRK